MNPSRAHVHGFPSAKTVASLSLLWLQLKIQILHMLVAWLAASCVNPLVL